MPKFSVVVPVYNAEKYIKKCVESVLSQSEGDFELILVNDGSTDGSGALCDGFALADSRIKVIHQPNSGPIAARKNGVENASGDYILFLDSDDYWLDGAFEKLSASIDRFGCDMLIFRLQKGDVPCHDFFGSEKENITHEEYFQTSLAESGMNGIVLKACARSLFRNVDFSSFITVRNADDLMMSTALARNAKKISYIPDVLYFYRTNYSGISNTFDKNALDEYVISRTALLDEIERLGLDTEQSKGLFYTGFLRRAADLVLSVSQGKMTKREKFDFYRSVAENPVFIRAMKEGDLSAFGKAKCLRLRLLKKKRFEALLLADKIRKML